ncbi:aminotransferase class III-fold pyridoxal phosphate-dependent enzyme [Bacillus licheniformis]|nr:aminotransferase class III-fold pyridoxal phosphate-dependent enzyme [Bacillus licheniformis]
MRSLSKIEISGKWIAALEVLEDERLAERSLELGEYFKEKLSQIDNPKIKEVRGRGLFIGVELTEAARPYCERLKEEGLLGLARTGKMFASDWEDVTPDMYILGKALGGGVFPISCIAANRDVLGVFNPGSHGSTFGGNPLACAVSLPGIKLIPYGDLEALKQAITPNTAAFLIEPIQGEAGIVIPPEGFLKQAAEVCKERNVLFIADEIQSMVLPMNTGAEAVESAVKAARRWAYDVKGVPDNQAEIIACEGNFHGRTMLAVSLSSEEEYKRGFGPMWVKDPEGNRYMDMLSAYSAVNQGHRHPKIIQALKDQADKITLTSRAFHNDQLGPFYEKVASLTGKDIKSWHDTCI